MATWEIRSEEDLWAALQNLLVDPNAEREWTGIVVRGWEPELLYFPDDEIESSFSPSTARALAEFNNSLARADALLTHGRPDQRVLTEREKLALETRYVLRGGSNGFNVFDGALDLLLQGAISKMTGDQIKTIAIIFFLLYFSSIFARFWIKKHYEEKARDGNASERMALASEETKRVEMITQAMERVANHTALMNEVDKGKIALLRGAASADRARVEGTSITAEEARTILDKERGQGTGKKLDGRFELIKIVLEHEAGYIIKIKNVDTKTEFDAEVNISELPQDDIHKIFTAAEKKNHIQALVNAWIVGDKITRAVIVRANDITE